MAKRHHYRRRRNPFAAGNINQLAVKVAGGLAGGIACATIPNMAGASLGSGWGGVGVAGVIAFGGSYLTKGMSQNLSEGWLIGGLLQTAGRVTQLLLGKNLVSFSLGTYAPMRFPVPTPAYNLKVGGNVTPMIPTGGGSKPMKGNAATSAPAASTGVGRYANSRWGASRFAA